MKKINWSKIWQLAKPVIIAVLAALGIFFPNSIFFIAILALSILFRGKSIMDGIKEIAKHVGPRPPRPSDG